MGTTESLNIIRLPSLFVHAFLAGIIQQFAWCVSPDKICSTRTIVYACGYNSNLPVTAGSVTNVRQGASPPLECQCV